MIFFGSLLHFLEKKERERERNNQIDDRRSRRPSSFTALVCIQLCAAAQMGMAIKHPLGKEIEKDIHVLILGLDFYILNK